MPSIHFTAEQVKRISIDDSSKYSLIERDIDYENSYKDYAPTTVIFQCLRTGKYYSLHYQSYSSHYGQLGDEYEAQDCPEVHLVTKEVTKIVKSWEAV